MASIFKILRSILPRSRPPVDIESAGSLYVNFADAQLGIMDEAGLPLDLLGIRFHKDTAGYVVDDIVAYEGRVYQCILEHNPEPFDRSKWNDLTADPETNHNVLVFRDADNSHPQSAITDLLLDQAVQNEAINQNIQDLVDHETVHNPHQKMDWVYPYVLGPLYKKHSVVNDNGWLRVANQDTSERAAPQTVGDPAYLLPEAPIWTPQQYLGNIKAGIHIFDPALIYEVKKYRVWIPTVTADAHYRIIFEDRITGVVTLGEAFNGDILDAPGYIETSIPPKYILPGDDYLLYMLMSNSATNQEYNHPWLYQGTSNQDIDPGIGNTARRGDHSRLNISSTDADGTNRDSELGSVIVGSTFSITSEINASRFIKYEVIGLRTNMTGWWLFEVALIDTGVLGEPTISERCQTYFVNPVLASTDYVEAPDIHLDLPAVTGILKLGEGVTTENNSSFGMDIKVQEMTASAHWDPAANSIEGGSGDTGGLDDHTLDFHSNVNAPTAQNDQRLAWDDATGMWVPKSSTSGLGIVSAHYKMGLPPNATPLSGDVSRDNADPALVTFLYLSTTDDNGDLRDEFWGEMKAGDWINIRKSNDLDINENYDISGPGVDNGTYWTIPVTPYTNAGVISDNDKVTVLWRIGPNYPHSVLVDVLPDDHHPQSHVHDGADSSGVIVHANTISRDVVDAHPRASITDVEGVFTDRLLGYGIDNKSQLYNGDIDTLVGNSDYLVSINTAGTLPSEFVKSQGGLLVTRHWSDENLSQTQYLYGFVGENSRKIWARYTNNSGALNYWKKITTDTVNWVNFTLTAPWENYDATSNYEAAYCKMNDIVYIKGLIKTGTSGIVAILPVDFRPIQQMIFTASVNSGVRRLTVSVAGSISITDDLSIGGTPETWTSLDCSFPAKPE